MLGACYWSDPLLLLAQFMNTDLPFPRLPFMNVICSSCSSWVLHICYWSVVISLTLSWVVVLRYCLKQQNVEHMFQNFNKDLSEWSLCGFNVSFVVRSKKKTVTATVKIDRKNSIVLPLLRKHLGNGFRTSLKVLSF